jgi:hypothetical protein
MAVERAAEQAARNAGRGRAAAGGRGGGGGAAAAGVRGRGGASRAATAATIDPMDPSSYSDAPAGGWSRGLDKA